MTSPLVAAAQRIVRLWTRLYTRGLDPRLRDERAAEIESDLWESAHDRTPDAPLHPAVHMLLRLLAGIPDDLSWRAEQRRFGRAARMPLEVTPTQRAALITAVASVLVLSAIFVVDAMQPIALPRPPAGIHIAAPPPPPPAPPPPPPPPPPEVAGGWIRPSNVPVELDREARVRLTVTLHGGERPRLTVHEGALAVLTLADGIRFGFQVARSDRSAKGTVRVVIYNLRKPRPEPVDQMDLDVGFGPAWSHTHPSVGVQVTTIARRPE